MADELRFVFDTNAALGAAIRPGSTPRLAIDRARDLGRLLFSRATIAELDDVIARPRFDRYLTLNDRLDFLAKILQDGLTLSPSVEIRECRDPNDDKFLELAVAGGAACLITGDKDLLVLHPFRGIPILTPRAFLDASW